MNRGDIHKSVSRAVTMSGCEGLSTLAILGATSQNLAAKETTHGR